MNDMRRRQIRKAIELLGNFDTEAAHSILEDVLCGEEEAMDNTPESLQESDRYQVCEESCELLEQAICDLDNVEDIDIDDVLNTLQQIDGV